jgi:hypothetical protein
MLPPYGSKNSPLSTLVDRLQRAITARRERSELARLDRVEIEALAHDVGVSIDDLYALVEHGPQSADLLPQLMQKLGLDPTAVAQAEPAVMRDLQRGCSFCSSHDRCSHDLARGASAATFRDYCLNAQTLDALMVDKAPRLGELNH